MSVEAECKLWFLQRGEVRMVPQCERPEVRLGSKSCTHFLGKALQEIRGAENVVDVCDCRRARETRKLPPINDRVPRKS